MCPGLERFGEKAQENRRAIKTRTAAQVRTHREAAQSACRGEVGAAPAPAAGRGAGSSRPARRGAGEPALGAAPLGPATLTPGGPSARVPAVVPANGVLGIPELLAGAEGATLRC